MSGTRNSGLLAAIIPDLARENGWQGRLEQYSLFTHWEKIVGQEIAKHAAPLKIVQNVLWLEVGSSAWMQHFQYQKLTILQTCNEFLPGLPLTDIRFVIKSCGPSNPQEKEPELKFIPPPQEEVAAFESMASTIKDQDSREALMQFWYLSHACQRDNP
ncbi:MAG: hypothetical protein CSB24_01245 [Deltaproteobacteria bacterium]|nr:MAG: hypothetical protein CSB24_01245 [Deltaproteobacteria bacterium]